MNLLLAKNSQYENFLESLNNLQGRMNLQSNQLISQEPKEASFISSLDALANKHNSVLSEPNVETADGRTTINLANSYFNKFSSNFYQHAFYHQASVEFKRDIFKNGTSEVNNKQLTATTKIRAFFTIKMHSQVLSDFLIIFMICVVIFNLDVIDSTLGNYFIDEEIHKILNL